MASQAAERPRQAQNRQERAGTVGTEKRRSGTLPRHHRRSPNRLILPDKDEVPGSNPGSPTPETAGQRLRMATVAVGHLTRRPRRGRGSTKKDSRKSPKY